MIQTSSVEGRKPLFPLKKILVSTDGSENAGRAVQAASDLAKQNNAELIVVQVVSEILPVIYSPVGIGSSTMDYSAYFDSMENEGKKLIDQTIGIAKSQGVRARGELLRTRSSTVESILDATSKEKCDLIVVGTRGLGGFKKLLLGSVSSGIVAHARCAVLVVR